MATIKVEGRWTVRLRKSGVVVAERQVKNILTTFGLTALAGAMGGNYTYPQYLAVETFYGSLQSPLSAGTSNQVILDQRVDQPNDTQLVLDPGQATQETVTYTSVTGSAPYTYTLSTPPVNNHFLNAVVVREVSVNDTMSNVVGEVQYDSVNAPNTRMFIPGGYSAGPGNWTVQAYFPGSTAPMNFLMCGLADSPTIGQGNLHNHFVLGFNHTDPTVDVEIDGSITLSN